MDAEQLLAKVNRTTKFRQKVAKSSSNIAPELRLFLKSVARPARRNVSIPDAFEQIAGENLARNCRIESLLAGVMKVKVKSGPYMFELRTRATQIVEGLKQQCPSSNIREIKLVCSEG
jgi:hypothetical protein